MSANKEFSSNIDDETIGFDTLSNLTGFPVEFLKKELILENENISMETLRTKVIDFIKRNNELIND